MEHTCKNIAELPRIADVLLTTFPTSKVFALYGTMGAGKTTFIKALCKQLHVKDMTNSPSFAIVNEYLTEAGSSVFHFDFYRIKKASEFFDLGCEEYLYSNDYCFIEWPEKIHDLLPETTVVVKISEMNGNRIFNF